MLDWETMTSAERHALGKRLVDDAGMLGKLTELLISDCQEGKLLGELGITYNVQKDVVANLVDITGKLVDRIRRSEGSMTTKKMFDDLAQRGGAIVSSGECCPIAIAAAKANGRFYVGEDGKGFVRRCPEWLESREKAYAETKLVQGGVG